MPEELFSTNEVAKRLSKTPVAIRKMAEKHHIGTKVGRDYVFTLADIEILKTFKPGRRWPKTEDPAA